MKPNREAMYNAYNPHRNGIWGMDLPFAAKALREVREALEHEQSFRSETAIRSLNDCLREAASIEGILAMRSARAEERETPTDEEIFADTEYPYGAPRG